MRMPRASQELPGCHPKIQAPRRQLEAAELLRGAGVGWGGGRRAGAQSSRVISSSTAETLAVADQEARGPSARTSLSADPGSVLSIQHFFLFRAPGRDICVLDRCAFTAVNSFN